MPKKYLLDASAIYPLLIKLREKVIAHADKFLILDLTIYEVGNIIWKEYRRGKIKDVKSVSELFEQMFNSISTLSIKNEIGKVLNLAIEENLTFYDASHLQAARTHKVKLVTEDQDLLKFPESINVDRLLEELINHKENRN